MNQIKKIQTRIIDKSNKTKHRRSNASQVLSRFVQNKSANAFIQRKLTIEDDYPQDYIDKYLEKPEGKDKPSGRDMSKDLRNIERLEYVATLIRRLSPHFKAGSGGVVEPSGKKNETELANDSKATASCCMHILTRNNKNNWKILVADHFSPHTYDKETSILINSELSPVKFGMHTPTEKKHLYDKAQVILGHEMCGHAALKELEAHPEGARAVTNVHDPTIKIENEIAKEQGEKKKNLRGMADAGFHRGESFGKMVIERFKLNVGSIHSLPSSEQNKMKMLADMIRTFDMFVELRGHSDNQGSEYAKQEVSDRRAGLAKDFLNQMDVSDTASVSVSTDDKVPEISVRRFVLKGLSDKEPPAGVNPIQQDRFRRVEVIVAGKPWALSELPKGITNDQLKKMELKTPGKDSFTKPDEANQLSVYGSPCEKLLIDKAYS